MHQYVGGAIPTGCTPLSRREGLYPRKLSSGTGLLRYSPVRSATSQSTHVNSAKSHIVIFHFVSFTEICNPASEGLFAVEFYISQDGPGLTLSFELSKKPNGESITHQIKLITSDPSTGFGSRLFECSGESVTTSGQQNRTVI